MIGNRRMFGYQDFSSVSRAPARSSHHRSNDAWVCSVVTSSARVRHQRCDAALVCLLHHTLAVPASGGQIATDAP
jgi:hypothetical protein